MTVKSIVLHSIAWYRDGVASMVLGFALEGNAKIAYSGRAASGYEDSV